MIRHEAPGEMLVTPKLGVTDGLMVSITFIVPSADDNVKYNLGGLAGMVMIDNHIDTNDFGLGRRSRLKLVSDRSSFSLDSPRQSDPNSYVTSLVCERFRARDLHSFLTRFDTLTLSVNGSEYELPPETITCIKQLVSKTSARLRTRE